VLGRFHGASWLLVASVAAWIGLEVWIFARDRRAVAGQTVDRGSLRVLFLGLFVTNWAAGYASGMAPEAHIAGLQPAGYLLGAAIVWAGIALRLWAVRTLGDFFRTTVTVQEGHRLVAGGPYRRLRHPSYTGMLLALAGLGLGYGNWISLALLTLAVLPPFAWRIHVEDAALKARFGAEWQAYAAERWAVIPFVW
jgi:protein-S-isoprenylcysteine O-methyltransferase Ste14